jgi:hypothetical protein
MTATDTKQQTCAERVEAHRNSRLFDLKVLYRLYDCDEDDKKAFCEDEGIDCELDEDGEIEDEGLDDAVNERRYEYGLGFDYVAPGTFSDQETGYWRYQISCGGPSEEIRFFGDSSGGFYGAEFWFLDWFDGARLPLHGDALETARAIWEDFSEMDMLQSTYNEAT